LHHSPLYTNKEYPTDAILDAHYSVDDTIKFLEDTYQNTIDMTKIVIGVAPYTRAWSGVKDNGSDKDNPGLYAYATPNSVRSVDGTTSGIYGFHDLPSLKKQFGLIEFFDEKAKAAYYYSPKTGYFFSCDNEESVAAKGKYVRDKGLGGLFMWMASYDAESTITKAMFSSLYEKGYTFPKRELIYKLISISSTIKATETGYDFTIQNNAMITETNPALRDAELFQNSIVNMIVTIITKSGTEFIPDNKSGTIVNENGVAIIDPSSNPDARIVPPNYGRYTFSVKINGTSSFDDIRSIYVSQRILPSMSEFKKRIIYDNRD
jgi:chitinase